MDIAAARRNPPSPPSASLLCGHDIRWRIRISSARTKSAKYTRGVISPASVSASDERCLEKWFCLCDIVSLLSHRCHSDWVRYKILMHLEIAAIICFLCLYWASFPPVWSPAALQLALQRWDSYVSYYVSMVSLERLHSLIVSQLGWQKQHFQAWVILRQRQLWVTLGETNRR